MSLFYKEVNDAIGHFSDVVHIPRELFLRFVEQDKNALVNGIVDIVEPVNMIVGQMQFLGMFFRFRHNVRVNDFSLLEGREHRDTLASLRSAIHKNLTPLVLIALTTARQNELHLGEESGYSKHILFIH